MKTRKTTGKEKTVAKNRQLPKKSENYFAGVGRRKSAVARVKVFVSGSESEAGRSIEINEKPLKQFFPLPEMQEIVASPVKSVGLEKRARVSARVSGGGIRGQAEAARLGVAKALVNFNKEHRKTLRDLGFLTRDDRIVERKKAGLKKARRAPQWKKR